MMEELVILLNEDGTEIGTKEKLAAHQDGDLHRAFSVVIFNNEGKMLVQQRALTKYHTPGIWSNSCCSHPRPGEDLEEAARRRLQEELGFQTDLKKAFSFTYKYFDEQSGLWEHELDTVFIGQFDGPVDFNTEEVYAIEWLSFETLEQNITLDAERYSYWFRHMLPRLKEMV